MTGNAPFRLFGFRRSMAAYRVRVALHLKSIAFEETDIDLNAGEQLRPDFLSLNPEGAVPALIEPGEPALVQSAAILEYLDERFPLPPVLPADARGRARVRALAQLIVADTHPLLTPRVTGYLARHGFDNDELRAWSGTWIKRGLAAAEAHLARDRLTGTFCHGDSVTIADICLASLVTIARIFKFEMDGAPTVTRIVDRCETIDAFARAHPANLGA